VTYHFTHTKTYLRFSLNYVNHNIDILHEVYLRLNELAALRWEPTTASYCTHRVPTFVFPLHDVITLKFFHIQRYDVSRLNIIFSVCAQSETV
jgi:hypothetical protein